MLDYEIYENEFDFFNLLEAADLIPFPSEDDLAEWTAVGTTNPRFFFFWSLRRRPILRPAKRICVSAF